MMTNIELEAFGKWSWVGGNSFCIQRDLSWNWKEPPLGHTWLGWSWVRVQQHNCLSVWLLVSLLCQCAVLICLSIFLYHSVGLSICVFVCLLVYSPVCDPCLEAGVWGEGVNQGGQAGASRFIWTCHTARNITSPKLRQFLRLRSWLLCCFCGPVWLEPFIRSALIKTHNTNDRGHLFPYLVGFTF